MQMDWSYVGAVVISGLVIVFVALILLIIAVWIMGKIFVALKSGGKKTDKPSALPAAEQKTASAPAPVKTEQPSEDDDEVIAVIAAAVAAMSEEYGKPLKIRSIKRTDTAAGTDRRSAWARAAAAERTRAF